MFVICFLNMVRIVVLSSVYNNYKPDVCVCFYYLALSIFLVLVLVILFTYMPGDLQLFVACCLCKII